MTTQHHLRLHARLGTLLALLTAFGCTATITDGGAPGGTGAVGQIGGATGAGGGSPGAGGTTSGDSDALADISRLTRAEYTATVMQALGIAPDVNLVPEDGRVAHFTSNVGVTPDPVHPYLLLAEELAAAVVPTELPACESGDIDACLEADFRAPLETLFRRPLSDSELATWMGVYDEVQEGGGDATQATRAMLAAALVSADFLFRSSPSNSGENAWARRVAEWTSFALWDAPPDEQLRTALEDSSALSATLQEEAVRLANDPQATTILARFFGQWLEVDTDLRLDEDEAFETSPDYLELLAFVDEALASGAPIKDFVAGDWGMVHPDNAELYGVDSQDEDPVRVTWPEESLRRGLLAQEILAGSTRHPDQGRRPIFRGLLVRRNLLCDQIPLPDPALVALAGEVEDRTVDARCANCHLHIDPIGYAFAVFDLDFDDAPPEASVEHAELAASYPDVAALLEAVADTRAFAECFSRQWLAFFLEQELGQVSDSWVQTLADLVESNASLSEIVEQTAFELAVRTESAVPWCGGE